MEEEKSGTIYRTTNYKEAQLMADKYTRITGQPAEIERYIVFEVRIYGTA